MRKERNNGLTLIELLLAVGLMAVVTTVAYLCYDTAVRAWRAGTELSNNLHQGDYIMEQVVMGFRSAYFVPGAKASGLRLDNDGGDGPSANDHISWVKMGSALIGAESGYASMPHVVELGMYEVQDAQGQTKKGFGVRSWRADLQLLDFDSSKVSPVLLSTRVVGFNCRVFAPDQPPEPVTGGKPDIKWDDEWANSNSLPKAVEITLFVRPAEEGKDPLEIKRIVKIPMAP